MAGIVNQGERCGGEGGPVGMGGIALCRRVGFRES